jgi:hypothetical protein
MSRARTSLLVAMLAVAALAFADSRSAAYRDAQRALEKEDWTEASHLFGKLASASTDEADAALYWKAYADWKRHDRQESLQSLRRLLADHPKSSWADDARVLEQEIRGGGSTTATSEDDEELKLYALDGLMQVDPAKAVPVLERILAGNSSARIKERALFVLSQSASPRAREILRKTARSGQPMELRVDAIQTLGIAGMADELAALWDAKPPAEIREAIIQAYLTANRPQEVLDIARSDPDPDMRSKAVQTLGAMRATSALRQLWGTERDPEVRAQILQGMGIAGDVETLTKVARESKDSDHRQDAIQGLGIAHGEPARQALRQLYGELPDLEAKREVAQALMVQGDAKTLIALFRAERNPQLKRTLVQQLSLINDPEANRIIFDLLEDAP